MATLKRWDGSAWQDITTLKRWDGSAWQDITTVKRWDGTTWQDIAIAGGGLSATLSKSSVSGASFSPDDACPVYTSESVTVSVSGGTGPYTYSWARLSGSAAIYAESSTSASTAFSASICFGSRSGVFRCTVEDSLGATGIVDVTITLP